MRYSRAGVVAMLLAAEVLIGGAIVWAATGGHPGAARAVNVNTTSELARLDAGSDPSVVVDDPDTRVVVTSSEDGKVHVIDNTHQWGWFLGPHPGGALRVERTPGGVLIRRGDAQQSDDVAFVGMDFQQTEVAVPPGSTVDLRRCGGASISGVRAAGLKISCGDGSLRLADVQSPAIDAQTGDGSIRAGGLRVQSGRLKTDDGSIHVGLADPNLIVRAQTGDGSIHFNGRRADRDGDSGSAQYQFGTGGGSLQVSTQDGSIHISTNGAV